MATNPVEQAIQIAGLLKQHKLENKIRDWRPIEKQLVFLNCTSRKKAIVAANRTGKTMTLLLELVFHATGEYPEWWNGTRFDHAPKMWIVSMSFPMLRDTVQMELFGPPSAFGTGLFPKHCLDQTQVVKKTGISGNVIEKCYVKHISGNCAEIKFFSGDQDRKDFQGAAVDMIGFDEEPKKDIHDECMIRLATTNGYALYSFTPLSGHTEVVTSLMTDPNAQIFSIAMDDCHWLTQEIIERLLHGMSDMDKRARRYGIPASGGGQIFQFEKSEYCCQSFDIPDHWHRLGGIDIGYNHPTGAVALAWDKGTDRVFIYQEYKAKEKSAVEVARNLRHWGVQFAGSHDAFNKDFKTGGSTADVFEKEGLHLFSAGRDPWARIEAVRSLIADGRLWIFEDRCPELVKEMQIYHTVTSPTTGKLTIFKKGEDVIDSFTHAVANYEKASPKGTYGRRTQVYQIKQWKPVDERYGI
jgi:phage terminase large subunit-like protein